MDDFDNQLPLPFRCSIQIVAGIWLWAFALLILDPLPRLIGHHSQHRYSTISFASTVSVLLSVPLVVWKFVITAENAARWYWLPNLTLPLVLLSFVPVKGLPLPRNGRTRLLRSLLRVSVGQISTQEDTRFGDILLADALTSYAVPISSLYPALCMWIPNTHHDQPIGNRYYASAIIPLLIAWPYAIRFRQTIICGQPMNALKYFTAFPVIIMGAILSSDPGSINRGLNSQKYWWLVYMTINSTYSLWWDIFRDWDLPLLARHTPKYHCYFMVLVDAGLRFMWCARVHWGLEVTWFAGQTAFFVTLLELMRRWLWLLFRVETEALRRPAQQGYEL